MKKILLALSFLISLVATSQVVLPYKVASIAAMKLYTGSANKITVDAGGSATTTEYFACSGCSADESTIYAGVGRNWKKSVDISALHTTGAETVTSGTKTFLDTVKIASAKNEVGDFLNDNFARASLGSSYTTSLTTSTVTFPSSNRMNVTGGDNSSNNYIEYNNGFSTDRFADTIIFIPKTNNVNDALGIAYSSVIAANTASLFAKVNLGTTDSTSFSIYSTSNLSTLLVTGSNMLFAIGDTLSFTILRYFSKFTFTLNNLSTGQSTSSIYTYTMSGSPYIPNFGNPRIYLYGGTQDILLSRIVDQTQLNGNLIFGGDSITEGYNASSTDNTYVSKAFDGNTVMYDVSAGVGEKTAEFISYRLQRIIDANPRYCVINLGVNDRLNSVNIVTFQANVDTIAARLQRTTITPLFVTLTPQTSVSVVQFNDSLRAVTQRRGIKLIDTYTKLTGGSGTAMMTRYNSGDGTHPNDAGQSVISQVIKEYAPELFTSYVTANLQLNRLAKKTSTNFVLGIDNSGNLFKTISPSPFYSNSSSTSVYPVQAAYSLNLGYQGNSVAVSVPYGVLNLGTHFNSVANDPTNAKLVVLDGGGTNKYGLSVSTTNGMEYYAGAVNKHTFHGGVFAVVGTASLGFNTGSGGNTPNLHFGTSGGKSMALVTGSGASAITFDNSASLVFSIDSKANIDGGATTTGTTVATLTTAGSLGVASVSPTSRLHTTSFATAYVAKTANYTATISDYTIDCTSNSFTVTLPTAVGITGRIYIIKNTGAGTITIATTSSQTIDNTTPPTVAAGALLRVQSTGANWIIL